MFKILVQPFPFQINVKQSILMSFIAGLFVFTVFYFLKPFGLEKFNANKVFWVAVGYALVTICLSILYTLLIPFIFPNLFNEKHWKVWKEMIYLLLLIVLIAIGNVLFTTFVFDINFNFKVLFFILKYTLAIGLLPILLSVVLKQQSLLAKYKAEAQKIDATILSPIAETKKVTLEVGEEINVPLGETKKSLPIVIKGDNAKELLQLEPEQFLYAEASDNYTEIHFLEKEIAQKKLFRLTIKNLEAQTNMNESIFRCHKSYIVNLRQVAHISGNAQGYKLHLINNDLEIPVSRSLNAIIKEKLGSLHRYSV